MSRQNASSGSRGSRDEPQVCSFFFFFSKFTNYYTSYRLYLRSTGYKWTSDEGHKGQGKVTGTGLRRDGLEPGGVADERRAHKRPKRRCYTVVWAPGMFLFSFFSVNLLTISMNYFRYKLHLQTKMTGLEGLRITVGFFKKILVL